MGAADFFPEIVPPKTPEEIKEEKRQKYLDQVEALKRKQATATDKSNAKRKSRPADKGAK